MKKNPAQVALTRLGRALASVLILLGILSLPWRAERPPAPPTVTRATAGAGPLSAGAAVRPIELGAEPTIAGFPRFRWTAEGVLHPVTARALVLSEPGCSVALASAEILLIPGDLSRAVKARVADLGLDAVVVTATHTHAGPGGFWDSLPGSLGGTGPFDAGAQERLVEALAGAIRAAHAAREPVALFEHRASLPSLVRNRNGGADDGRLLVLDLVAAQPPGSHALVGEVLVFASHPTMLGLRNRRISGDWPGRVLAAASPGPRLLLQGAVGDQSTEVPAGPPGAELDTYALALVAAVEALPAVPPTGQPRLSVATATVALPRMAVMAVPAPLRRAVTTLAGGLLPASATATAVRLGGTLLLFTPAEPVEAVGRAWREAVGDGAEAVSLADDYVGYADTAAQVEAGQGEAGRSYYGPALAERLQQVVTAAARAADGARPAGASAPPR